MRQSEDTGLRLARTGTTTERRWQATQDIRSDNPQFMDALPTVLEGLGLSEEEAVDLLVRCQI